MELFIYPKKSDTTDDQVKSFSKNIIDSLSRDSSTWIEVERDIDIGNNIKLPLFTHIKSQYQNEPFYFRLRKQCIVLKFENDKDESSKAMIIGMITYYLIYNLHDIVEKIEIK